MKYAIKMDSGVMMCIPSLIKTDSGIQKLMGVGVGGGDSQTHRQHDDLISLLLFYFIFQNEESRLKNGKIN
jgi:hypothetical protein